MFPYRAARANRRQMSVLVTLGAEGKEGVSLQAKKRLNMRAKLPILRIFSLQ